MTHKNQTKQTKTATKNQTMWSNNQRIKTQKTKLPQLKNQKSKVLSIKQMSLKPKKFLKTKKQFFPYIYSLYI